MERDIQVRQRGMFTPMVLELTREIERMRREAGLSIEELLTGLRKQREQYCVDRYGDWATTAR